MYKVKEISINGFWYSLNAKCEFNDNVNIIIGRNGTGKTTFMNILHSVLSVDVDGLADNDFDEVEIKLGYKKRNKTIKVKKIDSTESMFCHVEYQISTKKFKLRLINQDDHRMPLTYKRRFLEEASLLRNELDRIVSLSSLSVYRLRNGDDYEVKSRNGKRTLSPVDYRLSQLKSELTKYQFELAQKARVISADLQKDVLASILYSGTTDTEISIPKNYDKNIERSNLTSAYTRLNAIDSSIRKKIAFHTSSIDDAIEIFRKSEGHPDLTEVNFAALEAFVRTKKIIDMSLEAEEKTKLIYNQIDLFLATLKDFIPEKNFIFESSELLITRTGNNEISSEKLSSGEKQLLILLIETLLQKSEPYIYLTDEPELSLHIEWQRKIIPAVVKLNPNAQVIAATHSPEIASKFREKIIDMKSVIYG
tara:strand:+ start:127 stop:1392 length:1266 start_codon:yes stop_codon:yes gene_type:complete